MRDYGDVAAAHGRGDEHAIDGSYDATLCVDSTFPAARAQIGVGEEQIGDHLELLPRQITRG
jgi:hypothetical protein